ncbi:MAG: acyl-CoA dehydrogenase family protein [Candidatus Binataceae bacterium]
MLSFELSEEQQMIRDTVGAFAREQIRPAARPADESGEIPAALVAQAWQLGLVQGPIPESLGGNGDTRLATTGAIIAEELAYGDLAIAAHVLAPRLLAFSVLEMGTDEQRQRHLKRFTGASFAAASAALMEPRWDFDPAAMTTVARRDGNSFTLDGTKCMVALAAASDTLLVWAASANYDRVDGFLVARDTPGLSVGEREKNMGLKGLETFAVELKGCRVGAEARLGGERQLRSRRRFFGRARCAGTKSRRTREKHGAQGARDLRGRTQRMPRRDRGASGWRGRRRFQARDEPVAGRDGRDGRRGGARRL